MYYLRARYYDPSINRFVGEDPAEDGVNWYAYAGNNPVAFVDPMGLGKRNVVIVIGNDLGKSDHFERNAETYKEENKDTANINFVYSKNYTNDQELLSAIQSVYGDSGIDALIIESHGDSSALNLTYDYSIDENTSWSGVKFNKGANIRLTGCRTGGEAGYKNFVIDEKGRELVYKESIAQKIANKTGATVWGFVNKSSQKTVNGKDRQEAVDNGENRTIYRQRGTNYYPKGRVVK